MEMWSKGPHHELNTWILASGVSSTINTGQSLHLLDVILINDQTANSYDLLSSLGFVFIKLK